MMTLLFNKSSVDESAREGLWISSPGEKREWQSICQFSITTEPSHYIIVGFGGTSDTTLTLARDEAEGQFHELAEQWRHETGMFSSVGKKAMHPVYQRIIGMGDRAIAPMLRELQRQPDHWFWALTYITGEDPVPLDSSGNVKQMAEAWIKWGRRKGYIS